MIKTDQDKINRIMELDSLGKSFGQISKMTGIAKSTVGDIVRRNKTKPQESMNIQQDENSSVQTILTTKPVKTEEDVIREFNIDTSVWKIDRFECSAWTTAMKLEENEELDGNKKLKQKPVLVQNYRVKVYLKRIISKPFQDAHDIIFSKIKNHAPKYIKITNKKHDDGHLVVIGLFDAHFGKLCWGEETGGDYDLKIAERLFVDAAVNLIDSSRHMNIDRFMIPIGNDLLHIDSHQNKTTNGTIVDTDGRFGKIIATAEMAVVNAIDYARQIAPVDLVYVPGNHDYTTSYHLSRTLSAWYRNCNNVKIDISPSKRKYYFWEKTLLGLTHGNHEKKHDLTGLMALERPLEFSKAECREWLLGHEHRFRQFQTQVGDTHQGVVIRTLRSLSGTDAWHHENGFVGTRQAAETYYYDKNCGYCGHYVYNVKK
jgi:hypothetical protein